MPLLNPAAKPLKKIIILTLFLLIASTTVSSEDCSKATCTGTTKEACEASNQQCCEWIFNPDELEEGGGHYTCNIKASTIDCSTAQVNKCSDYHYGTDCNSNTCNAAGISCIWYSVGGEGDQATCVNKCTDNDNGDNVAQPSFVSHYSSGEFLPVADSCDTTNKAIINEATCDVINFPTYRKQIPCPNGQECIEVLLPQGFRAALCATASCGDGTCSSTENCVDCTSDCACTSPQTCNQAAKKCESPANNDPCKNSNACNPASAKNCVTCPTECACTSPQTCKASTKTCTTPGPCPDDCCAWNGGSIESPSLLTQGQFTTPAKAVCKNNANCGIPQSEVKNTKTCVNGCNPDTGTCATTTTTTLAGESTDFSKTINDIKAAVTNIACTVYCIVISLVSGIAALVIIVAGISYVTSEDAQDRASARKRVIYALVGIAIIAVACPVITFLFQGTAIGPCGTCDCAKTIGLGGSTPTYVGGTYACDAKCTAQGSTDYGCYLGTSCSELGSNYFSPGDATADTTCKVSAPQNTENKPAVCCCKKAGTISGTNCDSYSDCSVSGGYCSSNQKCTTKKDSGSCTSSMLIDSDANNLGHICKSNTCTGGQCTTSNNWPSSCNRNSNCQGGYCDKTGKCAARKNNGQACTEEMLYDSWDNVAEICTSVLCNGYGQCVAANTPLDCTQTGGSPYANKYCSTGGELKNKQVGSDKICPGDVYQGQPWDGCLSGTCTNGRCGKCNTNDECSTAYGSGFVCNDANGRCETG